MPFQSSANRCLTFKSPDNDDFTVGPADGVAGRVLLMSETDNGGEFCYIKLERTHAVAAALQMLAVALGEGAAMSAERAIAPHMKVSKP